MLKYKNDIKYIVVLIVLISFIRLNSLHDEPNLRKAYKLILNYLDTSKKECGPLPFLCKKNFELQLIERCRILGFEFANILIEFENENKFIQIDSIKNFYNNFMRDEKEIKIFDNKLKNNSKYLIYFYEVNESAIFCFILKQRNKKSKKIENNFQTNEVLYFLFIFDKNGNITKFKTDILSVL